MATNVICPRCEEPSVFDIDHNHYYDLTCPECEQAFTTLLAVSRSKRSRGNRATNSRAYTIRAHVEDGEELLEFKSGTYHDVELKAKDPFAVSFIGTKPILLQNYSLGKFWVLNRPDIHGSLLRIAVLAGVILLAILAIWLFVF